MANANYKVIVEVGFKEGQIQQQLDKVAKKIKPIEIPVRVGGEAKTALNDVAKGVKKVTDNGEDLNLTYNTANEILRRTVSIIGDLASQVATMDAALIEFQKVSDLSGTALDHYVDSLSKMGQSVARTGKPNRSEPVCTDSKCA